MNMMHPAPTVENLTFDSIKRGLEQGTILVVDVREENEFAAGHIPGAVLVPLSRFTVDAIPDAAGKRIVLSCRSGKRSLQAAALAHEEGLAVDAHYAGGFLDWQTNGGAIKTD